MPAEPRPRLPGEWPHAVPVLLQSQEDMSVRLQRSQPRRLLRILQYSLSESETTWVSILCSSRAENDVQTTIRLDWLAPGADRRVPGGLLERCLHLAWTKLTEVATLLEHGLPVEGTPWPPEPEEPTGEADAEASEDTGDTPESAEDAEAPEPETTPAAEQVA